MADKMRVGIGYDSHRLVEGRRLLIGGVDIAHPTGLLGHSDADVLVHALMDALLGAAALGDIGQHFPDTDPEFEGADSIELLKKVLVILEADGYEPVNADIRAPSTVTGAFSATGPTCSMPSFTRGPRLLRTRTPASTTRAMMTTTTTRTFFIPVPPY